jgi:TPR repeat protein
VISVAVVLLIVSLLSAVAGCTSPSLSGQAPDQSPSAMSSAAPGRAEALFVVDCLLPGQVRKLGQMTFLTARRPIKTSAQDCEIRGGEYVAYDRADYRTSLNVWLPQAQEGDKEAQTYVGEIYEKGLGVPPDYAVAVAWYRKAAAQGHSRAQINLGFLYEKGLGVEKDPVQALSWYRQASGLKEAIALDAGSNRWSDTGTSTQKELQELKQEVEQHKAESAALRQQLERTQQQLGQTQQELARRQQAADTERQQLEQARQEFEQRKQLVPAAGRDDTEVQRLEGQLQQREAELARRQQEVARLEQDKAQLEEETARQRKRLSEFAQPSQQVALAGPTIEVVDPPIVGGRRGLSVLQVSSGVMGQQRDIVGKVTAPAGVLTFTVNDRAEQLDDHGLFRVPVLVWGPAVPVKVVAVDRQGKSANVELQITVDTATPPAGQALKKSPGIAFGAYYALVIGNNTYTYWPSLNTPEQDARDVAEVLSRKYGFKTKVLLNATRFDLLQALNDFRKTLTENDNLLVYYAGHGHFERQIQRGYWVPVDSATDSDVNWIPTFAITDVLSAMSARHVLIVADSCYSGALTRSALAKLEAGMSNEARDHWLKSTAEKRSRTVLSSGGLQPVLDTGGGNHSVFAKAFLDVLASNTEILDGQRLGLEIAARVSYAAANVAVEQDPQYAPIRYAGHEAGDFLFVPTVIQ